MAFLYKKARALLTLVVKFSFSFSPFYWAGFFAQRERAQQDFKVPYKVPHLIQPPFTYERQPQHRDHPTRTIKISVFKGFLKSIIKSELPF